MMDPRYDDAHRRCASYRGWHFPPDREAKAIKGWPLIVVGLCILAVTVSMIAEVL